MIAIAIPEVGQKAPSFKLPSSDNNTVSLKDYLGKKIVVLYFYPKDDTSGCTMQACGMRDSIKPINKLDAVVLGVSPDSVTKHQKFIEKYDLPFTLLADEEKKICQKYGVWVEKSMYGRKYMGVARTTFIIDKKGKIVEVFLKVKPKEHEDQVIEALKSLKG